MDEGHVYDVNMPIIDHTVAYLTLWTPEAGLPTLRKLLYGARSR